MMTHKQYREAIARLGLTQVEASRVFGVSPRTGRVYASLSDDAPVPEVVELALKLMIEIAALKKKLARKEKPDGLHTRRPAKVLRAKG